MNYLIIITVLLVQSLVPQSTTLTTLQCYEYNSSAPYYSVPRKGETAYLDYAESEIATMCDARDPLYDEKYNYEQIPDVESVDFIVVGAGAAGSVVASRLSENSRWNVALIEAGGAEPVGAEAPSMYFTYNESPIDWNIPLKPMTTSCLGKTCKYPRGKVMGGTTVLNGLMYCRGDASDYTNYVSLGAIGWSYKDVLPYFLKSENNLQHEPSLEHAKGGLLTVSYYNDMPNLGKILLEAGAELGYPTDVDIGAGKLREGFYRAQMTTRNGARLSSAKAFVRPFLDRRKNLKILLNAQVTRVLLNEHNATIGVEYVKNNQTHILRAEREVILSAGTIHSPVILMHSGIGPAGHLKEKGIPVRVPLPGVGKNLRNHVSYAVQVDLRGSDGRNQLNNQSLATYVRYGLGPMSSTGLSQIGAMIAPNGEKVPNLQVFFAGLQALKSKTGSPDETDDYNRHMSISPTLLKTKSTGTILLESNDPLVNPAIYSSYLSYQEEVDALIKGIRMAEKIVQTNVLRNAGVVMTPYTVKGCEEHTWDTDEFWTCAVRHQTNPENHQVGTCKIGLPTDGFAVVDPLLRVYGTSKLRVIDASVLPDLPSGNLMAPTIMVGERGADFIKAVWRLSEEKV